MASGHIAQVAPLDIGRHIVRMAQQLGNAPFLRVLAMGFKSWLWSKLGMAEFGAEQVKRLKNWEYAQTNDWVLLEADPFKDEVKAAARLIDASPGEAFAQLLDLANQGSEYAMNFVAWSYAAGSGVTRDIYQAQEWYRRAYEGGSDRALLDYGGCLISRGEIEEAEKVYETGWERGFAPAIYRLIRIRLKPTLPLAQRLAWKRSLEWAVEAGHPAARYALTKCLCRGRFGVSGIPRGLKLVCAHLAAILRNEDPPVTDPYFR